MYVTIDVRHNKSRPMTRCRVMPPGAFSGMIPQPLSVYSESFVMLGLTVLPKVTSGISNVQAYSAYGAPLGSTQSSTAADFSQSGTATGSDLLSKAFSGIQQFAGYS